MKYNYFLLLCFLFLGNDVYSQIVFEDQATILGANITTGLTFLGNGLSFYDFDNDGWDDLTITTGSGDDVRFLKNSNGIFVEQNFSGLSFNYETKSVTWVDFDNDGDNDLFVTSTTVGNKLLENTGSMTFQDITATSGITINNLYTYGASWGDYNNDGFLDVFLSNRTSIVTNKLYKNDGDGTFTDVTLQSGIDLNPAFSFCSAFLDINNDGYQDIYVSNDKLSYENKLYKNNGDGTFSDISVSSGTNVLIDAMSVTVGDYNADGFFDIYVTNNPGGNVLLRNNGDETFTNVAGATGTSFDSIGWGASFFDADNDMDLDLYVSGQLDGSVPSLLSAAFYENDTNSSFVLNNSSFPGDNRSSYSNATGDINNDGLIDLVVSNNDNDDIFLWKNMSSNSLNWIKLKLIGTQSNRNAIGAKIEISINDNKQYRYTFCGEGYMAQSSNSVHFGLGTHTVIDYIKINWPSGVEEIFYNIQSNQTLNIVEGDNTLNSVDVAINTNVIYPNPVLDKLYIKTLKEIDQIVVMNALGQRLIYKPHLYDDQLDVSKLNAGQYVVSFRIENTTIRRKFIKK
ncbi:Por secretion system C-terminal sorting domain-containing protein [Formosa sp. Hel1_31_208]|uniref:FG-GAP-like repeat-containing protein n=1 Tax=Formosa sp. Hel1_31_208 TaxID=1798225 RepID=UPI00087A68E1|nr:FG-GAP-like repeat-containing protein [Formosa sp. Hel1_31_208]SDS53516.1 Por secretion system C-terminal sorting domain-containing protein [Formosa sp. Hel1_31_208]